MNAIEASMRRLRDDDTIVVVTHNMAQAFFASPSTRDTQLYLEGRYG